MPVFARLWLARDIAALGNWILFVALLIYAFSHSESGTVVSIVLAAQLLPTFLLRPLVQRATRASDAPAAGAVISVIRAAVLLPLLQLQPDGPLQPIVQTAFLASLPVAFIQASHSALLRSVVSPAQMPEAAKALSSTSLVTMTVGPALGGAIYGIAGVQSAAIAAMAAILISAGLLITVRPTGPESPAEPDLTDFTTFSALALPLTRAFRGPGLQAVAAVELASALLAGGLVAGMTMYTANGLFVAVENISVLLASQGAGAAVGALGYARFGKQYAAGTVVATGLALLAGGEIGFAISVSLPAGAALAAATGMGLSLLALGVKSLVPTLLGNGLKAPRGGGFQIAVEAAALLSVILAGPLTDTISPRFALLLSGILISVLALYAFGAIPEAAPTAAEAGNPAASGGPVRTTSPS